MMDRQASLASASIVDPRRLFADLPPTQLHDARRNDAVRRANDDGHEVAGSACREAQGRQIPG